MSSRLARGCWVLRKTEARNTDECNSRCWNKTNLLGNISQMKTKNSRKKMELMIFVCCFSILFLFKPKLKLIDWRKQCFKYVKMREMLPNLLCHINGWPNKAACDYLCVSAAWESEQCRIKKNQGTNLWSFSSAVFPKSNTEEKEPQYITRRPTVICPATTECSSIKA